MAEPRIDVGEGARRGDGIAVALWRNRRLTGLLVRAEFQRRYRGAVLGVLWQVLLPFLQGVVLAYVFTQVREVGGADDFVVYVIAGVLWWNFFSQTALGAASSIPSSRGLTDKVWFPRSLLPLAVVIANMTILLLGCVGAIGLSFAFGFIDVQRLALLPLFVAAMVAFTAGFATLAALANGLVRDTGHAIQAGLLVAFYSTPIFYEPDIVGPTGRRVLELNPMAGLLSLGRFAVSDERGAPLPGLWVALGLTFAMWLAAERLYRRFDHRLADVL